MAEVISPDGVKGTVPDDQLEAAVKAGYKTTQSLSQGRTVAEGAARGLSMGFGDELLGNFEAAFSNPATEDPRQILANRDQSMEGMRLRKEVNPGSALTGEIAGTVIPAIASGGGVSAVLGGGLKGAATENGLYGLGITVSEAVLNKDPLTLEKMAAGAAGGALTGGLVYGGLKGLEKGVSVGLKKLGGSTLSDTLQNWGKSAEKNALFQGNSKGMQRNEGLMDDILDLRHELKIGSLSEDGAAKATAHANAVGEKIGASMDDLERQVPLKGNDKARAAMITAIEGRLQAMADETPGIYGDALGSMNKRLEELAGDPNLTWQKVWNFQHKLYETLPKGTEVPVSKEIVAETRQAIRDHVFNTVAEEVQNGSGAALRKLGKDYAVAKGLESAMDTQVGRFASSSGPVGNKVMRIGSLMYGGPTGLVTELGAEAISKQLSKRGGFLAGSVLRKLTDSGALDSASEMLSTRLTTILNTAPKLLGAAAIPLGQAVARGGASLVEEHARIASGPDGDQYLALLGLSHEDPEEVQAAGARLSAVQALRKAQGEIDARIDKGVAAALSGKGKFSSTATPSNKVFEQHAANLSNMLRDPENVYNSIPTDIAGGAPATAGALSANLLKGAQFLDSKAPKNPYRDLPKVLQLPWHPSRTDVEEWYRYVEAVENPAVVLDRMAHGMFSKEHKEAVQSVYPQLYEEMKTKVFEQLSVWDKPLPYGRRAMLAQMFGPQVLGLQPGAVMMLQKSFQPAPSDGMPSKGGSRPDARKAVDPDSQLNLASEGQKLQE